MVIKAIFSFREEVRGGRTKTHNLEFHSLHSLTGVIRAITSRRMRWAGQVARIEEMRRSYKMLAGKPEGRNHLRDLGVDVRIILKWTLGGKVRAGCIWLRIGTSGGLLLRVP
jgi:hypothetical protein